MEAWRQWRESQRGRDQSKSGQNQGEVAGVKCAEGGAPLARMRRCLILCQGASPLRPPAPFPSDFIFQKGRNLSRVRKPRTNRAPLTDSYPSEDFPVDKGKGASVSAGAHCLPLVGLEDLIQRLK
jgi:hypothetical protein